MEMLNTPMHGSALPDHALSLREGLIVMLPHNTDSKNIYVNGTRYAVEDMKNNFLFLRILTAMGKGGKLTLPLFCFGPIEVSYSVLGFMHLKFPIPVCGAISTNKAQGQAFGEKYKIDLHGNCFAQDQLYVALPGATPVLYNST